MQYVPPYSLLVDDGVRVAALVSSFFSSAMKLAVLLRAEPGTFFLAVSAPLQKREKPQIISFVFTVVQVVVEFQTKITVFSSTRKSSYVLKSCTRYFTSAPPALDTESTD